MAFKPSGVTVFINNYFELKTLKNVGYIPTKKVYDMEVEIFSIIEQAMADYQPKKGK